MKAFCTYHKKHEGRTEILLVLLPVTIKKSLLVIKQELAYVNVYTYIPLNVSQMEQSHLLRVLKRAKEFCVSQSLL